MPLPEMLLVALLGSLLVLTPRSKRTSRLISLSIGAFLIVLYTLVVPMNSLLAKFLGVLFAVSLGLFQGSLRRKVVDRMMAAWSRQFHRS